MDTFQLEDNRAYFTTQLDSKNLILSVHDEDEDEDNLQGTVKNAIYTGNFKHHQGSFELKESHIDDMIENFEKGSNGIEPAINYNHEIHAKAAGWPVSMKKVTIEKQLSDGTKTSQVGIDMKVKWTPAGAKAIRDKEFKHFSIEFAFEHVNSETREKFKNVVTGGALTNKPFLKNTAITALEQEEINEGGKNMSTKEELKLSLKKDFDLDVDVLMENSKKLAEVQEEVKKLEDEVKVAKEAKEEVDKKIEADKITHLLEECIRKGTVVPAEKDMFQEVFVSFGIEKATSYAEKLSVKVKFEAKGNTSSVNPEAGDLNFSEKLDIRIEAISKEKNISYNEAHPIAVEEFENRGEKS